MNSLARIALVTGLRLGAGATSAGCGGDAAERWPIDASSKVDASAAVVTDSLALTYSPMYSAFIEGGAHEAQLSVTLKDYTLRDKGAKYSSSDPSIAVVVDTEEGALITVKKEGSVIISVNVRGTTGSANLKVTKYTETQWTAGQARFFNGKLAIVPGTPDEPITLLALGSGGKLNANGACSTCHTAQAQTLKIETTPKQIGGYSDEELREIFERGIKPDGFALRTPIPAFAWGTFHSWTATEDEKLGLIAFMRTQLPKENPAIIDYGLGPCSDAAASMTSKICDKDGHPLTIPGSVGALY
jgi:mono/diheme cytochrome c family protein